MPYEIQRLGDARVIEHPFGMVQEFFGGDGHPDFNIARVTMSDDRKHYHKRTTEIYYFLSGTGRMETDGEEHRVEPHTAILIEPGTRHRAKPDMGDKFELLVFSMPAYDKDDEFPVAE